jgi:hypothetical protein
MADSITASRANGNTVGVNYEGVPDTCPICHHGIEPRDVAPKVAAIGEANAISSLQFVMRCPRTSCGSYFIAVYEQTRLPSKTIYYYTRSFPKTFKPVGFDDAIKTLSPAFVDIYNQAIQAEALGLKEITGVGLRKALEFLIKDYCIAKKADKAEEIKKTFLAKCIAEHISDANIRKCAERATWLGNDETHYVRVWEEHDLSDLKTLIRLTVNWVTNELLTEQYFTEMKKQ